MTLQSTGTKYSSSPTVFYDKPIASTPNTSRSCSSRQIRPASLSPLPSVSKQDLNNVGYPAAVSAKIGTTSSYKTE